MTTDTAEPVTSGEKLCRECETVLSPRDARYARCSTCRTGRSSAKSAASTSAVPELDDPSEVEPGVVPLAIPYDKTKPAAPPKRDYYWCGCTDDAPSHSITIGGVSFPRWNGKVVEDAPGRWKCVDRVHLGTISHLTEKDVASVLERCSLRVVRNGELISAKNLTRSDGSVVRYFVPQESDRPLGQYVYMIKVRHADDRPLTDPPTLIPRE